MTLRLCCHHNYTVLDALVATRRTAATGLNLGPVWNSCRALAALWSTIVNTSVVLACGIRTSAVGSITTHVCFDARLGACHGCRARLPTWSKWRTKTVLTQSFHNHCEWNGCSVYIINVRICGSLMNDAKLTAQSSFTKSGGLYRTFMLRIDALTTELFVLFVLFLDLRLS